MRDSRAKKDDRLLVWNPHAWIMRADVHVKLCAAANVLGLLAVFGGFAQFIQIGLGVAWAGCFFWAGILVNHSCSRRHGFRLVGTRAWIAITACCVLLYLLPPIIWFAVIGRPDFALLGVWVAMQAAWCMTSVGEIDGELVFPASVLFHVFVVPLLYFPWPGLVMLCGFYGIALLNLVFTDEGSLSSFKDFTQLTAAAAVWTLAGLVCAFTYGGELESYSTHATRHGPDVLPIVIALLANGFIYLGPFYSRNIRKVYQPKP